MPALATTFQPNAAAVARSALAWWAEAGVTDAIAPAPRAWLDRAAPVRRAPPAPPPPSFTPAAPIPAAPARPAAATEMPANLPAFREWLATAALPGLEAGGRRFVARGPEQAEQAVVIAMPGVEDGRAGELCSGAEGRLLAAMLSAASLSPDTVALIPVLPARIGGPMSPERAEAWRSIVARHLSLIGARRLLLLGDGPGRTLLGEAVPRLRTRWHSVKLDPAESRAVASFDLATLLSQPSCKRLAWDDLLLFTEGPA